MNTVNDKIYIGSSIDIKQRWKEHLWDLKGRYHKNLHLQRAWNKYGEDFFIFEVLLYCDKENLVFCEQRAMDEYKSLDGEFGYNMCPAARFDLTGSNYDEWRNKISENRKGEKNPFYKHTHTEEQKMIWSRTRSKENHFNYGKHHSKETRKKISEANSGKNHPNYGRKCPEHSKKMTGKNNTMYGKRGKNHPNYGKKASKETIQKMRDSIKNKSVLICEKIYKSITQASRDLKVCRGTISYRIKTNKPGYSWL